MATNDEVSVTGQRLASLRAARKLSAAELASLLEGTGITKTVITNVESGRKRDLTAIELAQIASALHVSPLAMLADPHLPWSPVSIPSLSEPFASMSNAEYLYEASPYRREFWGPGGGEDQMVEFFEAIGRLEYMAKALTDLPTQALVLEQRRYLTFLDGLLMAVLRAWCALNGARFGDVVAMASLPSLPVRVARRVSFAVDALERGRAAFPDLVDHSPAGPHGAHGALLDEFMKDASRVSYPSDPQDPGAHRAHTPNPHLVVVGEGGSGALDEASIRASEGGEHAQASHADL